MELERSAVVEDETLVEPLEVEALLDAAAADNAVASSLVRRNNPVIVKLQEKSRSEGLAEGLRRAVRRLCGAFDIELDAEREGALTAMGAAELEALQERLLRERRWS